MKAQTDRQTDRQTDIRTLLSHSTFHCTCTRKCIDASAYDDVVEFRDPITNYNSLSGYLFNIQMLKQ
eukprot:scaffold162059_cov18-Tisochrysis_lutea.AAC.1